MSSIGPEALAKTKSGQAFNRAMEAAALAPHENIILGDVNIHIVVKTTQAKTFISLFNMFH